MVSPVAASGIARPSAAVTVIVSSRLVVVVWLMRSSSMKVETIPGMPVAPFDAERTACRTAHDRCLGWQRCGCLQRWVGRNAAAGRRMGAERPTEMRRVDESVGERDRRHRPARHAPD